MLQESEIGENGRRPLYFAARKGLTTALALEDTGLTLLGARGGCAARRVRELMNAHFLARVSPSASLDRLGSLECDGQSAQSEGRSFSYW